jgi:hypothetical protein
MVKSKLAIFSFVCSLIPIFIILMTFILLFSRVSTGIDGFTILLGIFMGLSALFTPILILVSFITSIISLSKIKKYKLEGKNYAIAALIISGIILGLLIIFIYNLSNTPFPFY